MAETKKTVKKTVKKAVEVKSIVELQKDLDAKRLDLMNSRKSHRANELVNPRVLGTIRKEIARLLTAIRAAQAAEQKESK